MEDKGEWPVESLAYAYKRANPLPCSSAYRVCLYYEANNYMEVKRRTTVQFGGNGYSVVIIARINKKFGTSGSVLQAKADSKPRNVREL